MNFVRSFASSVTEAYNSINPATLTGAIDVIVVEQEDGSLACSPFHVRFGKYQILRPSQKKVDFKVNNVSQSFPMKLGEGGEAFFVFETSEDIPAAMQTSPLVSPVASPEPLSGGITPTNELQEPEPLDISTAVVSKFEATDESVAGDGRQTQSEIGEITPRAPSPGPETGRPLSLQTMPGENILESASLDAALDDIIRPIKRETLAQKLERAHSQPPEPHDSIEEAERDRALSPPPVSQTEAVARAMILSRKLWSESIPCQINDTGDLMIDMAEYKTGTNVEEESLRVEVMARKLLSEEIEGNYDIGALISMDEQGNIWIYSSEEAKMAADRKASMLSVLNPSALHSMDVISDPGYHSDDGQSEIDLEKGLHQGHMRRDSDSGVGLPSPTHLTAASVRPAGDPNLNYAKTLRLSSDQLKALELKPGLNSMSFHVNKATAQAFIYFWRHDVPIVISDIDGTITKSDAMGHMMNAIGRDWTHQGVAKLYTDISSNGYNLMYLTSRSVGQADSTRNYLNGIVQDGYKVPRGPVILSPDRTIAALRREVIIRKPEVFKMACLRDIMNLFQSVSPEAALRTPFYAGFGNRLNDAMSYRSVSIPATRIFTINSNAEVSLYLTTLSKYRTSYVSMREIVDHYFPPVGMLVKEGGEEYTDFNYWRDRTLAIDEFSASESGSEGDEDDEHYGDEDDYEDDDMPEYGESSYYSQRSQRKSMSDSATLDESIMESIEDGSMAGSAILEERLEDLNLAATNSRTSTTSRSTAAGYDNKPASGTLASLEQQAEAMDPMASRTPQRRDGDQQSDLRNLAKALASPERTRDKGIQRQHG